MNSMPRLTDVNLIRALLHSDRTFAVYALADLAPEHFAHATWFGSQNGPPALVLLYRRFEPPVLFALGSFVAVDGLLDEMDEAADLPELFLHVRPEIVELCRKRRREVTVEPMWRMVLDHAAFRNVEPACVRLTADDVPALERLYADGDARGERPHFFLPSMVSDGIFFGVREGDALIAAAGTHVVALRDDVAAIGNVYTRFDRRGRGLAAQTTAAVASELVRLGVRTIVLNVAQANTTAERVYARLGFRRHCAYCEGRASGFHAREVTT